MKLHAATTLAERIRDELQPFCERIEIAGSIRRARAEVNDIDFVVLPAGSKAQSPMSNVEQIKARCLQRCRRITDGRQNFVCAMRLGKGFGGGAETGTRGACAPQEFQIDIFFAHAGVADLLAPQPSNFGSLLLCRTGSKEHNIKMARRAKELDMHWNPYQGLFAGGAWEFEGQESVYRGGEIIAAATEEEIFKALGMEWLSPVYRETTFNPGPTVQQILSQGNEGQGNQTLNVSQPASSGAIS